MSSKYIQYGCRWIAPESWRNFDSSYTLRFERLPVIGKLYSKNETRFPENVEIGDIVRGLSVAENSCKGVYCSHVLEHLPLKDFRTAIENTHKILKIGGCFRFVTPDLEYLIKKYINNTSSDAALIFLRDVSLGREKRNLGLKSLIIDWLGNSRHLWMWDYKAIVAELEGIGFIDIRKAEYGDSKDPMFKEVEEQERWLNCLGVECKKA